MEDFLNHPKLSLQLKGKNRFALKRQHSEDGKQLKENNRQKPAGIHNQSCLADLHILDKSVPCTVYLQIIFGPRPSLYGIQQRTPFKNGSLVRHKKPGMRP